MFHERPRQENAHPAALVDPNWDDDERHQVWGYVAYCALEDDRQAVEARPVSR